MPGAPPPSSNLTSRERAIVARHRTPERVQRWLRTLPYNKEPDGSTCRSFRAVVRHGEAHCLEGAIAAAAILEHHGHPPLLLSLDSADGLGHGCFLFQRDGKWGAVGKSRFPGLFGRKPVFRTVEALARSYCDPFIDYTGRVTGWALVDLREMPGPDWRLAPGNVWRVERFLIEAEHARMRHAREKVARLRALYRAFKARNPHREPGSLYAGRHRWL